MHSLASSGHRELERKDAGPCAVRSPCVRVEGDAPRLPHRLAVEKDPNFPVGHGLPAQRRRVDTCGVRPTRWCAVGRIASSRRSPSITVRVRVVVDIPVASAIACASRRRQLSRRIVPVEVHAIRVDNGDAVEVGLGVPGESNDEGTGRRRSVGEASATSVSSLAGPNSPGSVDSANDEGVGPRAGWPERMRDSQRSSDRRASRRRAFPRRYRVTGVAHQAESNRSGRRTKGPRDRVVREPRPQIVVQAIQVTERSRRT